MNLEESIKYILDFYKENRFLFIVDSFLPEDIKELMDKIKQAFVFTFEDWKEALKEQDLYQAVSYSYIDSQKEENHYVEAVVSKKIAEFIFENYRICYFFEDTNALREAIRMNKICEQKNQHIPFLLKNNKIIIKHVQQSAHFEGIEVFDFIWDSELPTIPIANFIEEEGNLQFIISNPELKEIIMKKASEKFLGINSTRKRERKC